MIVVAMTPRSGSDYLTTLMRENGLGSGQEFFRVAGDAMKNFVARQKIKTYDAYVRRIIELHTVEGVFVVKVGWLQWAPLYYHGAFDAYFRSAKFIYLTRGNLLMQAISRYIGTETGYFHSNNEDLAHTQEQEVPMDFDKITDHVNHLVDSQSAWEHFFGREGIAPLRLLYEDIEANPELGLRKIFKYVQRPTPDVLKTETELQKTRNERNLVLRAAYIKEARKRRKRDAPAKA